MTRDAAKQELVETARALLAAMQAGERMTALGPQTSLQEAEHVQADVERLKAKALARFKTMCARLAVYAKNGV